MAYDSGEDYNPSYASTRKDPAWKIRLGKAIFWTTVAFAVWFFYWFNAIQCPCWDHAGRVDPGSTGR